MGRIESFEWRRNGGEEYRLCGVGSCLSGDAVLGALREEVERLQPVHHLGGRGRDRVDRAGSVSKEKTRGGSARRKNATSGGRWSVAHARMRLSPCRRCGTPRGGRP